MTNQLNELGVTPNSRRFDASIGGAWFDSQLGLQRYTGMTIYHNINTYDYHTVYITVQTNPCLRLTKHYLIQYLMYTQSEGLSFYFEIAMYSPVFS